MSSGQNLEDQSSRPQSTSSPTSHVPQPDQSSNPIPTESSQPTSLPNEVSRSSSQIPKKNKSLVWNHFEKVNENGVQWAQCLHCNKRLSDVTKNGTSHLRDHIAKRCTRKHMKLDIRQQLLSYNDRSEGKARLENYNFE